MKSSTPSDCRRTCAEDTVAMEGCKVKFTLVQAQMIAESYLTKFETTINIQTTCGSVSEASAKKSFLEQH